MLETVNFYADEMRQNIVPVIMGYKVFNWLYLIGVIGLLGRLIFGIVRLGGLSQKAVLLTHKGFKIADLPGRFSPFSFFHVIFVNRALYSDDDLDKILVHEMAHVRFKHSLDVMLFELLLILQWFNPFAWLIRQLLKELHEFQADRSVINTGASIGGYKEMLLFQATGARLLPVNNFSQSITKKRFKMMTNNTLNKTAIAKSVTAILLIVGVGFFFACNNEINQEKLNTTELKSTDASIAEKVYEVVDVMPVYPGGVKQLKVFITNELKYPRDAHQAGVSGKSFINFIVSKTGEIKDAKVIRSAGHASLDTEALRVINAMEDWTPGLLEGEPVSVSYRIPINFKLTKKK
ncbi:M56 family metallopeptidase [bacterium]|nr:M56 family metallopeptidase [bacterium]